MKVKNLHNVDFEEIMECFFKAFDGYVAPISQDLEYYRKRWRIAFVDPKFSYGMFDENNQLMGFVLNGINKRDGENIAFNTGTGVIPEYRGQKMVKALYDYALPELKTNGITKCSLEVIKVNDIAIKTYEGIGFETCKDYKCFGGEIKGYEKRDIEIKELKKEDWKWDGLPNQESYSWDNHRNSIENGDYRYFTTERDGELTSFFITNESKTYVAQCDVLVDTNDNWKDLLYGLSITLNKIKINNVDEKLVSKIKQLENAGLVNTIDQYEMERFL